MSTHRRIPWFSSHEARSARVAPIASLALTAGVLCVSACQTQSGASDNSVGQTRQAVEAASAAVDPGPPPVGVAPSAAGPVSAAAPAGVGVAVRTVTRLTADGEAAIAEVPAAVSSAEVPEGAPCGVVDANGALQSCQPGTYCVSEGGSAKCVKAPPAPRWDG